MWQLPLAPPQPQENPGSLSQELASDFFLPKMVFNERPKKKSPIKSMLIPSISSISIALVFSVKQVRSGNVYGNVIKYRCPKAICTSCMCGHDRFGVNC